MPRTNSTPSSEGALQPAAEPLLEATAQPAAMPQAEGALQPNADAQPAAATQLEATAQPAAMPQAEGAQPTASFPDTIVRGTAADGMVRALAISARNTAQAAQDAHDMTPLSTAALGRLMMAAQMMGALFKAPGDVISLMVECDGPITGLTVSANTEGNVKGYATNPQATIGQDPASTNVPQGIGHGMLTVVRESPFMEPYVSQIALLNGTLSDDLTAYYIVSEQIPTLVGLDVTMGQDGRVARAGGYFIQLMPDYPESLLGQLEQSVSLAGPLEQLTTLDPATMLERLLAGMDFKAYEKTPAAFSCDCSREKSERTLLSLGATELQSMIDEGKPVDITCDYCNQRYTFTIEQLQQLKTEL